MSDWWTRQSTTPDWHLQYSHDTTPDWWMIDGANMYGPQLNAGVGYMDVGIDLIVGVLPVGDAATQISFIVS
jgi:hypothetical protein